MFLVVGVAPQSVHARLAGQQRAVGYVDPRGGTRSLHGLASVLQAGMTELGPPVTFTTSVGATCSCRCKPLPEGETWVFFERA